MAATRTALEAFLDGADPQEVKPVPWPTRPEKIVGLRPLLRDQLEESERIALKWGQDNGIPHVVPVRNALGLVTSWSCRDDSAVNAIYMDEVVARALVDPDDNDKRICPGNGPELRRIALPATVAILGHLFLDWTAQKNPEIAQGGTPEQFDRILAALGEGQGATVLEACGPTMLRDLLLYTVAHPEKFTPSTSSTTTPDFSPSEKASG